MLLHHPFRLFPQLEIFFLHSHIFSIKSLQLYFDAIIPWQMIQKHQVTYLRGRGQHVAELGCGCGSLWLQCLCPLTLFIWHFREDKLWTAQVMRDLSPSTSYKHPEGREWVISYCLSELQSRSTTALGVGAWSSDLWCFLVGKYPHHDWFQHPSVTLLNQELGRLNGTQHHRTFAL